MQAMCDVLGAIFAHIASQGTPEGNDDKGQHAMSVSHSFASVVLTLLHDRIFPQIAKNRQNYGNFSNALYNNV